MTTPPRLTSAMIVATLCRQVQAAGGFAAVLHRGDADAGAIIIECADRGVRRIILEKSTDLDGRLAWRRAQGPAADQQSHQAALEKRLRGDPDLWVVELDIADAERFTDALFE